MAQARQDEPTPHHQATTYFPHPLPAAAALNSLETNGWEAAGAHQKATLEANRRIFSGKQSTGEAGAASGQATRTARDRKAIRRNDSRGQPCWRSPPPGAEENCQGPDDYRNSCQGSEPGAPVFHTARPQRSRPLCWVTHRFRQLRTLLVGLIDGKAQASTRRRFRVSVPPGAHAPAWHDYHSGCARTGEVVKTMREPGRLLPSTENSGKSRTVELH